MVGVIKLPMVTKKINYIPNYFIFLSNSNMLSPWGGLNKIENLLFLLMLIHSVLFHGFYDGYFKITDTHLVDVNLQDSQGPKLWCYSSEKILVHFSAGSQRNLPIWDFITFQGSNLIEES